MKDRVLTGELVIGRFLLLFITDAQHTEWSANKSECSRAQAHFG